MFLLIFGCATTGALRVDPDVLPVLPSPRADQYTRVPGASRDPLVASVSDGLPWDEALSGVAGAVALAELEGETVDACRLRWMAILAGYPYPLLARASVSVPEGEVPATLVAEARKQAGARVDVGLVRARGRDTDRWVLVVGEHTAELPAIPREVARGEVVTLGAGDWSVSDPFGQLRPVAGSFVADAQGEWMLSARDGARTIATFPVYVDEEARALPPFACTAASGDPLAQATGIVRAVRAGYGFTDLTRDPALDSVARARLRALLAGGPVPDARAQLRAAGFIGVPVAAAACSGATVEACLSQIWWSPEGRGALVGDLADVGIAVESSGGDVHMVVLGAG